jgi:5-(carboxyamino)imidazole ribonucleotide synthase
MPAQPFIGILGGGQLARMLALSGIPMGLRFRVLDPSPNVPAADVAEHIQGDYTDPAALARFADGLSVITYEFENVPSTCLSHLASLAKSTPIYPPPAALSTGQDRLAEKTLFRTLGIPVANFADITSLDDLVHHTGQGQIGLPSILKTRTLGYDGKGQAVLSGPTPSRGTGAPPVSTSSTSDLASIYHSLNPSGTTPLILEEFIPFQAEGSILAVRSIAGEVRTYPLIRNIHSTGILRRSTAPFAAFSADLPFNPQDLQQQAVSAATKLLNHLGYVGLLTVEFFIKDGVLIANEIAPRVHNSGHWTIEGSISSQFENHIRAVAGLPLGDTAMITPATCAHLANLVGDLPDPSDAKGFLSIPGCHLHLYGKSPRPARKIGHATVLGTPTDPRAEQMHAIALTLWKV